MGTCYRGYGIGCDGRGRRSVNGWAWPIGRGKGGAGGLELIGRIFNTAITRYYEIGDN